MTGGLIARDAWVAMQLRPNAEVNYRTGALGDLAGAPAPRGSRVAMRVLFQADALTDTLMGQLRGLADRVLSRSVHARARTVVEGCWEVRSDPNLYFLYERGQRLRPVARDKAEPAAQAWAQLLSESDTPLDAGVLLEFLRADPHVSLDQAWMDLRQALDLVLTPEAPPPLRLSLSEPNVVIQTDPAEARRITLLDQKWPTSTEAGQSAGSKSANPGQWAKDKRDAGQLLGVWDDGQRTFRHPPFQFTEDGSVRPEVKELLAAMAEHPLWTQEADINGWRRTYWLFQPFRSLSRRALAFAAAHPSGHGNALHDSPGGAFAMMDDWLTAAAPEDALARTPAEVFVDDPQAVIAMARQAAAEAQPDTDVEGRKHGQ